MGQRKSIAPLTKEQELANEKFKVRFLYMDLIYLFLQTTVSILMKTSEQRTEKDFHILMPIVKELKFFL